MAKAKVKAKNALKLEIENAARIAAQEAEEEDTAFESPEERDLDFASNDDDLTPDYEREQKDVFVDGRKLAKTRFKSARWRIYREDKWLGTKEGDYSWEKVQKEYGGGQFRIVAVDSDNKFLTSQSLEIEYPDSWKRSELEQPNAPEKEDSALATLGFLQQSQERAENRAREMVSKSENGFAQVMQAMTMQQQKSQEMQMTMMMESNKQMMAMFMSMNQKPTTDPLAPFMPLITALVTQKPVDTGPKPMELIKLLEDAKREAKREAKEDQRTMHDTARKLAEEMTPDASEGEESLTKTIIKSVGPVLATMMQESQKKAEMQAAEQLAAARIQQGHPQALNHGFIEGDPTKAIGSARPNERRAPRPAPRPVEASTVTQPEPPKVENVSSVVQPTVATSGRDLSASGAKGGQEVIAQPVTAKELVMDGRLQEQMFNFCAPDIGQAMLNGHSAAITARGCLAKLEKEGLPRQTVANAFKLEDFYAYAEKYGLPEEAKGWLKEFHEAIASETTKPKPASAVAVGASPVVRATNGSQSNGAAKPATTRTSPTGVKTRVQPRQHAKDL